MTEKCVPTSNQRVLQGALARLIDGVRSVNIDRREWYTHIAQPLQDAYQALGGPTGLGMTAEEIARLRDESPVETSDARDEALRAIEALTRYATGSAPDQQRLAKVCKIARGAIDRTDVETSSLPGPADTPSPGVTETGGNPGSGDAPLCNCQGEECHGPDQARRYGYRCRDSL